MRSNSSRLYVLSSSAKYTTASASAELSCDGIEYVGIMEIRASQAVVCVMQSDITERCISVMQVSFFLVIVCVVQSDILDRCSGNKLFPGGCVHMQVNTISSPEGNCSSMTVFVMQSGIMVCNAEWYNG